jgi:hypothetical protein
MSKLTPITITAEAIFIELFTLLSFVSTNYRFVFNVRGTMGKCTLH